VTGHLVPTPPTTWDGRLGRAHGTGTVRNAGPTGFAVLAGCAFGVRPGRAVAATLDVAPGPGGDDRWTRRFGRRRWTTVCTPTTAGFVEWVGPGARRHLVGLDLVAAFAPERERATLRLRAVRLGRWRLRPPAGLQVTATVDATVDGLDFATSVSLLGRTVVAYEGSLR
jgi:hypothetical protein